MVRAGAVKLTLMVAGSGRGFADCYSFETNRRSGYGACEHVVCGAQQPQHQDALSRMTRLTNAFSKKVENHAHAMALHFLYYNFVRIHKTLKVTPAIAAGVTDRLWEVTDMVSVLEAWETSLG
jgi:hypothetical protein